MRNSLAALRQSRGLTQEALGVSVGVSRQTIISIERGKFDPSLPLAFKLAEYFDTNIHDMFVPE